MAKTALTIRDVARSTAKTDAALSALEAMGVRKDVSLSQAAEMFVRGQTLESGALGGPSDPFRQSLWVNRCVTVIARSAAGVPVRLSAGEAAGTRTFQGRKHVRVGRVKDRPAPAHGEKAATKARPGEIVEGGDLFDLLARPNPDQTWGDFLEQTVGCLLLPPGRVHWLFDEMVGRRPRTIYVVPGHLSKPITTKTRTGKRLAGWEFSDGEGGRYPVPLDECITFQFRHPLYPLRGVSPVEPANLAIISDYNATLFNAAVFGNSAEPGGLLESDAPYNAEQDAQIKTTWNERHAGPAKAKRVAVLWGGLKWQSIASTMKDMQFGDGKRLTRTEECASFGVPEVVAGFYTDANYQFAEQGRMQFWQETEMPLLGRLGEGINVHLCPRFEGNLEAWFDVEQVPIVQKMRLAALDAAAKLWDRGVPMADLDDLFDLGLPERPWYETGFLPAGLLPASEIAAASAVSPEPEGTGEEGADLLGQSRGALSAGIEKAPDAPSEAARERLWRAFGQAYEGLARRGVAPLRIRFVRQERKTIQVLRRALEAVGYEPQKSTIDNLQSKMDPEPVLAQVLAEVLGDPKDRQAWRVKMQAFASSAQELGLRQALTEAGLSGDALEEALRRVTSLPSIQAALGAEAVKVSTLVDSATRRSLKRHLADGLGRGETMKQLATRVQQVLGARRASAIVVARNAVGQTLSRARHEGHRAAGMTHRIWLHSRGPGDRRPAHVAAEAYYEAHPVGVDEAFIINGVSLMYPRDHASGHPDETANCQCVAIAKRAEAGREARGAEILAEQAKCGWLTWEQTEAARQMKAHGSQSVGNEEEKGDA